MSHRILVLGPVAHKVRIQAAIAGLEALGHEVVLVQDSALPKLAHFGRISATLASGMHARDAACRGWLRAKNVPLLVIDCGYFRRASGPYDQTGYNQLGLERLNWVPAIECSADRWQTHGIAVADPVQRRDKIALVLDQVPGDSQHGQNQLGLRAWLSETAAEFIARGYAIVHRPHPQAPLSRLSVPCVRADSSRPLAHDLANASIAITYNSTAGLEALMAGVPVRCHPDAHYAHVADLRDRPALMTHLHRLAWTQWTAAELRTAAPWRWIAQHDQRLAFLAA